MYRQFDLKSDDHRLTCWLKCDGDLRTKMKPGTLVTLKHEPDRWWEVTRVGTLTLREPPRQFWKVGGLL